MKRTIKLWEIALLIGCLLTLLFGNLFQAEKTVSDFFAGKKHHNGA